MKHIKPFLESNNEYYQELDQTQFIRYIKDYDKRIPFDKNTYEKIKSLFSIENKNHHHYYINLSHSLELIYQCSQSHHP